MQAIILAAGMGKRLKELTQDNTKCMVKVNGAPLIDRTLDLLSKCDLSKIIIVTGYEGEKLKKHIASLSVKTPVIFIDNPVYDKTNNIYSLFLAREYMLGEDTLLLESDIIFEPSVLDTLINSSAASAALVAKYEPWMDGTCVKLSEYDDIESMIPGSKFEFSDMSDYYKTVNLYKFGKEFSKTHYVPFLEAYIKALGNNEYYEQVLKVIVTLDNPEIKAVRLSPNQRWYEIDDMQDLDIAQSMFAGDDEKLELLAKRYGGYWRYPRLKDFCYLVNPYYPPHKLLDEIKANFEKLACQYPSGMQVNSLLAARNFGVKKEHIVVGNGAAELIKSLMEKLDGGFGFIRPSFEEYHNRYALEESVIFIPDNDDFSYNAMDIINFFENKPVKNLLLVNPDNPSGNYIIKADVLKLMDWCKNRQIRLIIDESFIDFSDETGVTFIDEEIFGKYPELIVIKSISKSYGIPGLRLGVAAGAGDIIACMKKNVAIWNINSPGEFYMQISEKYKKDYLLSLKKVREERTRFMEELRKINYMRVINSQANYVMIELLGKISSAELAEWLLTRHNILIKDLSAKAVRFNKQYIRIAVRDAKDDDCMIEALKGYRT